MLEVADINSMILVGGRGTRLRTTVSDRPKVLAPVNDRPFLTYILDQLVSAGFQEVILCTGYMGDMVKETFGYSYGNLTITYSQEKEPLGTGGALRLALPMIKTEYILAMNGDSFVDASLAEYLNWHVSMKAKASLLMVKVNDTRRYGQVEVNRDGGIVGFEEKGVTTGPGWINAGVYTFARSLLELIPEGRYSSLEREFLPALIGTDLIGYPCDAKFIDIGTPESYSMAETFFAGITF